MPRRYYPRDLRSDDDEGHPCVIVTLERVDHEEHLREPSGLPARLTLKTRDIEAAHLLVRNALPVEVDYEHNPDEVRRDGGPLFGDDVPPGYRRVPRWRGAFTKIREGGDDDA